MWQAEPPPVPIEIVQSRRRAYARTYAGVGEEGYEGADYDAGDRDSDTNDGSYDLRRAIFAEVVTEQEELLTRGNAIVETESWLANDGFTMSGRLATGVAVKDGLTDLAYALASASSNFSVTYRVNEPLGYSLSASLAGDGDVGLDLRMYRNGDAISSLQYVDGLSRELQICGMLMPGEYFFELTAYSRSSFKDQRLSSDGGEAVFDFDFDTLWSEANSARSGIIYHDITDAAANAEPHAISVPEPSVVSHNWLLVLVVLCQRHRKRSGSCGPGGKPVK